MDKLETHHQVQAKPNQLFLHHVEYNVDYILEVNHHEKGLELTVIFVEDCDLSETQKNEIIAETKSDFMEDI